MEGEYAGHDDCWAKRPVGDIVSLNDEGDADSNVKGNARRKEGNAKEDVGTKLWHDASQRENQRRNLDFSTVRERVFERRRYSTHLHDSGHAENMTPASLYSIFNDENVNRVMYPSREEVDFAAIEQHSHCQVTRAGWLH